MLKKDIPIFESRLTFPRHDFDHGVKVLNLKFPYINPILHVYQHILTLRINLTNLCLRGYLEFKLLYLKNLKLYLIRVKESFESIILRRKGDEFSLFLEAFS